MYLFSRRRQINPARARAALGVAMEAAHRASGISGYEVTAWSSVLSPELGWALWSLNVQHLEELEVAMDKLAAESDFGDFVETNDALFTGPGHDQVLQVVAGSVPQQRPAYIQAVRAQPGAGALAESAGIGVEIAQRAKTITGLETVFATNVTGPFAGAVWLTGAPDLKAVEEGDAKLMADAGWLHLLDRASRVFLPSATSVIYRRLT